MISYLATDGLFPIIEICCHIQWSYHQRSLNIYTNKGFDRADVQIEIMMYSQMNVDNIIIKALLRLNNTSIFSINCQLNHAGRYLITKCKNNIPL